MENFFERVAKAWPAGRRDLHWHILPAASEADALLASYPRPCSHGRGSYGCRVSGSIAPSCTRSASPPPTSTSMRS
ncbi:hypothetical protein NKH18_00225 [Streptomyces sp. M10(2022)]